MSSSVASELSSLVSFESGFDDGSSVASTMADGAYLFYAVMFKIYNSYWYIYSAFISSSAKKISYRWSAFVEIFIFVIVANACYTIRLTEIYYWFF